MYRNLIVKVEHFIAIFLALNVSDSSVFVFCLFVLRCYGQVNSYGHVEPVSYPGQA